MNCNSNSNTYDPETYWDSRAEASNQDELKAVSVEGALKEENRCIDRIQRHLMKAAMNAIREHSDLNGKKVLDFGCGTGRWTDFFSSYGLDYHGIDISNEMLKIGCASHNRTNFRHIKNDVIPFPDNTFHLVCSLTVLHHNAYENQEKMVGEMVRVLQKDGYLLLFEAYGKKKQSEIIMFPRMLPEWINLVEKQNLSMIWLRYARYWFLRSVLMAAMSRQHTEKECNKFIRTGMGKKYVAVLLQLRKLLSNIDSILGPIIIRHLPAKYQNRAVMIFVKT